MIVLQDMIMRAMAMQLTDNESDKIASEEKRVTEMEVIENKIMKIILFVLTCIICIFITEFYFHFHHFHSPLLFSLLTFSVVADNFICIVITCNVWTPGSIPRHITDDSFLIPLQTFLSYFLANCKISSKMWCSDLKQQGSSKNVCLLALYNVAHKI